MPRIDRFRALYVLKYLWENTDEDHPVTLVQIQNYLTELEIESIPKTIDMDITALQELGFETAVHSINISLPAETFRPLN